MAARPGRTGARPSTKKKCRMPPTGARLTPASNSCTVILYILCFRINEMVKTITYSKARASLSSLMEQVVSSREPVYITRRGSEEVALISAEELSSIIETVHLLRSPENARRLLIALNRAYEEDLPTSSLEELRQELGIEQEGK